MRDVEQPTLAFVLTATTTASAMSFIMSTSVGVVLPAIQTDLSLSGTQLLWVANGYTLFLSALILAGGALADQLGLKRVFTTGVILFGLASLGCGLAPSGAWLIAGRVAQGVAAALMVPTSLALLSASAPAESRGRAIGLWSALTSVALAFGPIIGGWVAGQGLWRVLFLLLAPMSLLSVAAVRRVDEPAHEPGGRGIDWRGAAYITAGLALVTYGITEGPGRGWTDPLILGALALGAAFLALFVNEERRCAAPLVPLDIFRSRNFTAANVASAWVYAGLIAFFVFLPLNLIQLQGYSDTLTGFTQLPFIIPLILLSTWAGGLTDRVGPRWLLTAGPLLVAGGFALLSQAGLTAGPADYWTRFFPGSLLIGLGMGITVAPLTATVMGSVDDERAGAASGINNAVTNTAQALSLAALGALALVVFGQALTAATADLALPNEAQVALAAEAERLAAATVPDAVPAGSAQAVGRAIDRASVDTFRVVMLASGALAALGGLTAAAFIRDQQKEPT